MDKLKLTFVNGYRVAEYEEKLWLEVFHHKYIKGIFFRNNEECNFSLNKNRFSVLRYIDDTYKIDNKYKFIQEYPQEKRIVRWDQELSIMSKGINVMPTIFTPNIPNFEGIVVSSDENYSCFDGTPTSDVESWWNAIGTKVSFNSGIPGIWNTESASSQEVSLWIMINKVYDVNKIPIFMKMCSIKRNMHRPQQSIILLSLTLIIY